MTVSAIAPDVIDRACLLFLRGRTVRSLAAQFKLKKSTLHYHLVRRVGKGANRSRSGCVAIIDEFLQTQRLTPNQRASIQRWTREHLDRIVQVDAQYETGLLTRKREQALTNAECGSICDFRANLTEGAYAA